VGKFKDVIQCPAGISARPAEREHPGAQINHSLFNSNKIYENSQKEQIGDKIIETILCRKKVKP